MQTRDVAHTKAARYKENQSTVSVPLRVFLISYLYERNIRTGMGGFQKVLELARQFNRRHRVTLFLPSYSRQPTDLDCVWIPVIDLPKLRLLSFNCMLIPALILRALGGGPHVIYQRVFNSISPPLLAKLLGATYVIELNGNPLQFYKTQNRSLERRARRLLSWSLCRAHKIVALTEGLQREIQSDFGVETSKVHVVPSGSNPHLFFPRDRAECRQTLGIAPNVLLAVFAGTFFPYQGIDALLDALKHADFHALQVWLLGDGVMRTTWQRRAAELGLKNVRFTGQVEYSRVAVFIGASDFCFAPFDPSRGEVSPLKVLDYLFCARPTVIAQIPAVENLIRKFPSLLPFTPGDSGSLADKIRLMLRERDSFSRLAMTDAQAAAREYSWEQIAHQIESTCFPIVRNDA